MHQPACAALAPHSRCPAVPAPRTSRPYPASKPIVVPGSSTSTYFCRNVRSRSTAWAWGKGRKQQGDEGIRRIGGGVEKRPRDAWTAVAAEKLLPCVNRPGAA